MKKYLILSFIILFPIFLSAIDRKDLKDGDLIFQDLNCGPMCDAIEAVTEGYRGRDFSHIGMVYHRNDSTFVLESIGEGVHLTNLSSFLARTTASHLVGRLKPRYEHLISQALGYGLLCIGMNYDQDFIYDNGKYYCSELIYDAFKHANKNKPFFHLFPMTYKIPESQDFYPVWIAYFKNLGEEIPEGKLGCNPGGISLSDKIVMKGELE